MNIKSEIAKAVQILGFWQKKDLAELKMEIIKWNTGTLLVATGFAFVVKAL